VKKNWQLESVVHRIRHSEELVSPLIAYIPLFASFPHGIRSVPHALEGTNEGKGDGLVETLTGDEGVGALADDCISEFEDGNNTRAELVENCKSELEGSNVEEGVEEGIKDGDDKSSVLEDVVLELVIIDFDKTEDDKLKIEVAEEVTLVDEDTLDEDAPLQSPKSF
jgi:hypothetical protein